ncbi:MAG: isoaspartyl peptidase/L-asparaginase [Alphaproteobacteria bacterium]|nr:isoaspartyl peptidase/L-asparaginase [Alphaproteobacteria bacterium]
MRIAGALAILVLLSACAAAPARTQSAPGWSIAIHGGAGIIERPQLTAETEAAYRDGLARALAAGAAVLRDGGASLDAVEAAARILEDDPLFNAGRGAVFTADGRNELDASIMDGRAGAAGAVAGVTSVRNPISLARAVMEKSPHVMLMGAGAEAFATEQGLARVPPAYFFTERRWLQLEETLRARGAPIPARPEGATPSPSAALAPLDDHAFGTIGVVARDQNGHYAAGTSTGGTTGKRWGRVGDSPVIGAGTFARNGVCAVSATGTGEYFIRLSVARTICARIEYLSESGKTAADAVIRDALTAIGGDGCVIVIDAEGAPAWSFNTPGMYRGFETSETAPVISIFADEP